MSPQAGWILQDQIAPRLGASIPRNVKCVGAEDHQELIADGISMAARMVDRLEQQNKFSKVTPRECGVLLPPAPKIRSSCIWL